MWQGLKYNIVFNLKKLFNGILSRNYLMYTFQKIMMNTIKAMMLFVQDCKPHNTLIIIMIIIIIIIIIIA